MLTNLRITTANRVSVGLTPGEGESAATIAAKIGMNQGEQPLKWSLRAARRVVHYSRPSIIDLVLTNQEINYDKRAENPVVTYALTYKNFGKRALNVDLEVQSVSVPRDDRNNTNAVAEKHYCNTPIQSSRRRELCPPWQAALVCLA